MGWYTDYEEDLQAVFSECRRIVAQYPAPLATDALAYLAKFDVSERARSKNYICYLLPFWLQEATGLSIAQCRAMAVDNIFCMLYFFIQDDVFDAPAAGGAHQLPLANLFYGEFLAGYPAMFPQGTAFWTYYRTYLAEWADSVKNEATADYFRHDPLRIAGKSSPLKLCSTAALLLADKADRIPAVTRQLEYTLVALQMADDLSDWAEDLEIGSYNSLLSLAASMLDVPSDRKLTEAEVRSFLYDHQGLTHYSAVATGQLALVERAPEGLRQLAAYHRSLVEELQGKALRIDEERKQLAQGGLLYWLARNQQV